MQSGVTTESISGVAKRLNIPETEFERRGVRLQLGLPITCAATVNEAVAVGFGDGSIRVFRPGLAPTVTQAHAGVILCMVADRDGLLTGGDDGRFLRFSLDGTITELANFGTKWVDCVASNHSFYACSSGPTAYLWSKDQSEPQIFEHLSTVGGLAFGPKGHRFAVAHYGGVTLRERVKRRWKSSTFAWKGFHGAVTFSPDEKYLVTAMQENALHGWRLRDKGNLAMAGYPAKIKSFTWVGDTPHLATSGADEASCWPFDGKFGPMERSPVCVAKHKKQIATYVEALAGEQAVFVGFQDGAVMLAEVDESKGAIAIRGSTGAEVTAIVVSNSRSHILTGDAEGNVLWAPLWAGNSHARDV